MLVRKPKSALTDTIFQPSAMSGLVNWIGRQTLDATAERGIGRVVLLLITPRVGLDNLPRHIVACRPRRLQQTSR
jgi:hypothetical protein